MFSIVLLDFFAKAGIQRRQGKKCDRHCDKDQVIHKNFRRAMRLQCRQDATVREPGLIKNRRQSVKKALKSGGGRVRLARRVRRPAEHILAGKLGCGFTAPAG